jgi:hypothetical protein
MTSGSSDEPGAEGAARKARRLGRRP